MKSPLPERLILEAVREYLEASPKVAYVWRNTAGTARFHGKHYQLGEPGLSDLIGFMRDGRILAVEVKAARGKLTKAQETFLRAVQAAGGVGGVARSVDDAMELLS